MKNRIFSLGEIALSFAACSVNEMDIATPADKEAEEFFATIEDASTKVFVDDELMVLWHADDRVSIFNKYTYNQQYRFTGNTGANSGSFTKVPNDDFITGNALNYVYAIYPYKESTEISNQGVLTIDLPAIQSYAENSFGIGANTMISCSEGNELLFKNLCGYIMLKLYGDDVSVTSISIKGNNNEPLAGKATVNASIDNAPTMTFDASATNEITLSFDTPVTLGTTAESATTFWLVVPPTTFSKGITLTVKDDKNGEFKKSTTASLQISRNTLKRMSALEAIPEPSEDAIVFADPYIKAFLVPAFDTNGDGEISYKEAASATSIDGFIGSGASGYVTSFDEFRFFTGITSLPDECFHDWNHITSIVLPDSIVTIGDCAFMSCTSLTSMVIPKGVTRIGSRAFYGCYGLGSVTVPESVMVIGEYAFSECHLASITIPESVISIGVGAFQNCSSLSSMVIPPKVKTIGDYTFYGCSSLASVVIPDSVMAIGKHAFEGCSNITSMVIPQNVTTIGEYAFRKCTGLKSIILPNSITTIEASTFSGCSSLTSVVIPDRITTIGDFAFSNCASLNTIEIPNTVKSLGAVSFGGCTSLTSVLIPDSVKAIGSSAFSSCSNLVSVTIPRGITTIKSSLFHKCSSLTQITIPESVTKIESSAFNSCSSLTTLSIPKNVNTIGDSAFEGCTNLTSITVYPETPPIGGSGMFKLTNNCPIYVPSTSLETYMYSNHWSDYADRIQAIPSVPVPVPEAVDLGLPSGIKWASFNLGASAPEEYGDYYAWGETEPYYCSLDPLMWKEGKESGYRWSSYKWSMGSDNTLTKYCTNSRYGYNGFTDTKTVLDPEDDAAHVNLGGSWRMPTDAEWTELRNNCTWTWTTINGVSGIKITSTQTEYMNNWIFLPAAGLAVTLSFNYKGTNGYYWSSSLSIDNPFNGWSVFIQDCRRIGDDRFHGFSVRPVYAE